jgi:hypothetical protein
MKVKEYKSYLSKPQSGNMARVVGKSKKLVLYLIGDPKSSSISFHPTRVRNNRFAIKYPPRDYGFILSYNKLSDQELGKAIRRAFRECD